MLEVMHAGDEKAPSVWIPWRYLVPRPGYARLLRVARACPELRPYVDREAFLKGIDAIAVAASIVMVILALPLMLAGLIGLVMTQVLPRPDMRGRLEENAKAGNRLVPPAEVERRLAAR